MIVRWGDREEDYVVVLPYVVILPSGIEIPITGALRGVTNPRDYPHDYLMDDDEAD